MQLERELTVGRILGVIRDPSQPEGGADAACGRCATCC